MGSLAQPKPFNHPEEVDKRAIETPHRTYALVPRTQDLKDGYESVTYQQLSRAINKTAFWLDERLPRRGSFDTFTYLGPNDIRWAIVLLASQKTGRKLLILNPNNSLEGDSKLITETKCVHVLVAARQTSEAKRLVDKMPFLQTIDFPDLAELLKDDFDGHYEYHGPDTVDEADQTPVYISHTSGTTGESSVVLRSRLIAFRTTEANRLQCRFPG